MSSFSFIPTGESGELAEDIRELFEDLATHLRPDQRAQSGECYPALDVLETDEAIELVMDASGVAPEAVRVLFHAGVLVIAGEKAPGRTPADHTFHLIEREFGRFARVVRLNGAFDIPRARATVAAGELTVVLPKLVDRRGRAHRIEVTAAERPPA